jgi:hypothetical protein
VPSTCIVIVLDCTRKKFRSLMRDVLHALFCHCAQVLHCGEDNLIMLSYVSSPAPRGEFQLPFR